MASNPPLQSEAAPVKAGSLVRQFRSPEGWLGRFLLWDMNRRHSRVTDWGLNPISVTTNDTILDVGCGGGRTISKLAARAPQGKVYGIDHSSESVAAATKTNAESIGAGRVQIQQASVSELPFPDDLFDLVTAVETHFWWPDMPAGPGKPLGGDKGTARGGGGARAAAAHIAHQPFGGGAPAEAVERIGGGDAVERPQADSHRPFHEGLGHRGATVARDVVTSTHVIVGEVLIAT